MFRLGLVAVVAFVGIDPMAPSAPHPDFSGRWVVVAERTTAAPTWGQKVVITQDDKTLKLERFIANTTETPTDTATILLTGAESKNPTVLPGGVAAISSSSTKWDGDQLVITTLTPREGRPTVKTTRSIRLEGPITLVIQTVSDSPGVTPKTTTVYARQPAR